MSGGSTAAVDKNGVQGFISGCNGNCFIVEDRRGRNHLGKAEINSSRIEDRLQTHSTMVVSV